MNNNRKNSGFTLIEVLIALIILAIALTAIILAVQTDIRSTKHIQDKLGAHWVAMNILSSLQVGLIPPPNNEIQQGENEMLNKAYVWTTGVEQAGNGSYERVYVNVRLKNSSAQLEHLVGFLLTNSTKKPVEK